MIEIDEGKLRFLFPDRWNALKYDAEDGFVALNCIIPGTKRVDIVARSSEGELLLIEVKDFRGHRIENKHRTQTDGDDPLHIEVAQKVRDTFACFLAAHRSGDTTLKPFYDKVIGSKKNPIDVILFLEEDKESGKSVRKPTRQDIRAHIQKHLKPFHVNCQIQRRVSMPAESPWKVIGIGEGA